MSRITKHAWWNIKNPGIGGAVITHIGSSYSVIVSRGKHLENHIVVGSACILDFERIIRYHCTIIRKYSAGLDYEMVISLDKPEKGYD